MDNDLVRKENWLRKNRKWFLPIGGFFTVLFIVLLSLTSEKSISDIAKAYTDNSLYEKAIDLANLNPEILEVFGTIKPIDKLAILEGDAEYSNNNNSVNLSIRISGVKTNGKLDISASKKGNKWQYQKITLRAKNPKKEIVVLDKI